ncbi:MAG: hypothetical protein JW940_21900 [Polyangiaceae bacterium]|nr:hypothetical protein [Polyangiaceae bacterium]
MMNRSHKVVASVLFGVVVAAGGALGAAACASVADDGQSLDAEDEGSVAATEQAMHSLAPKGPHAKYVFSFIGDGMASVQIYAAEKALY